MRTRIQITDAAASKRLFGWPIVGLFRTALPVESSVGPLTFLDRGHVMDSVTPLPDEVEEYLESAMPKHPRGEYVTDPMQVRRRLQAVGQPKTRREFRRAFEAFALSPEWFAPSPERDAAAAETESLWPWDVDGQGQDRAHEEAEARAKAAAEARAKADAEASKPNTRSLRDLGKLAIFLPTGSSPTAWPTRLIHPSHDFPMAPDQVLAASLQIEGGHLVVFDADELVEFRDGLIPGTAASIVTSYIPTKDELARMRSRSMTASLWDWLDARAADDSPLTSFRDGRTDDGEAAEAAFREHVAPWIARHAPTALDARAKLLLGRVVIQMAVRGYGLAPKLAKHVYREMGASPLSDGRVDELIAEAIAGKRAWISPDEFLGAPAPQAWAKTIDTVATVDTVTSAEVERALVAAGLVTTMTTEAHQRVIGLMRERGYAKRQITVDGKRTRAFVRSTPRATSFFATVKSALGFGA